MDMMGHFLAALSAALVCAMLLWLLRRMMLTPVKTGKNTVQYIFLSVKGCEAALENNVGGLLWLNDNGILRCRIIISGSELDDETRAVARVLERDHSCITFVENGEIPECIRKTRL